MPVLRAPARPGVGVFSLHADPVAVGEALVGLALIVDDDHLDLARIVLGENRLDGDTQLRRSITGRKDPPTEGHSLGSLDRHSLMRRSSHTRIWSKAEG